MSLELATGKLQIKHGRWQRENIDISLEQENIEDELRAKIPGDASIVLWEMHRILWGRWQGGKIVFPGQEELPELEQVLEVRIFNEQAEVHLKKYAERFIGRLVRDEGETVSEYVDSMSRLWGSSEQGRKDGFALLEDKQRKLKLLIPTEKEARFYGLVTRNYILQDENNGQAGYDDYRFLRITDIGREVE